MPIGLLSTVHRKMGAVPPLPGVAVYVADMPLHKVSLGLAVNVTVGFCWVCTVILNVPVAVGGNTQCALLVIVTLIRSPSGGTKV